MVRPTHPPFHDPGSAGQRESPTISERRAGLQSRRKSLLCGLVWLVLLHWFFEIFHAVLTLFNCVGWMWRRTRRLHLFVLLVTLLSWFGLGYWYGWGYCVLTDWHWEVKERLGHPDPPSNYAKYLLDNLTGLDWDPALLYWAGMTIGPLVLVISIALNIRDWRREKRLSYQADDEVKSSS